MGALSELKIKNLKPREKRYMECDGQGLYLAVYPSGEKYWYYRFWDDGKDRKKALGRYPDISLKKARELRYQFRYAEEGQPVVFSSVAQEWFENNYVPSRAERTVQMARSRLENFILPVFGGRDINSITPKEVFDTIKEIQESSRIHTGRRVKNLLSQIFSYAVASGVCKWNPVQQVTGALAPMPQAQHYSVINTETAARQVLKDIMGYSGDPLIRLGLLTLAYTFVRPGEMRVAQWGELNLEKAEWRIPAERMKMRREHLVPLSNQAIQIFQDVRELNKHPVFVFIMPGNKAPISAGTFSYALRSLGYGKGKMTPHGFRGMASTLLNEHGFPPDVIERQLAHVETNQVRAAYNRAEYLEERRKMMKWWGDYLDKLLSS